MSQYHRTTRECSLAELLPELAEAIRSYAQQQQWVNLEVEVLACCETTAERTSTNLLEAWLNAGTPTLSHLALIATSERLIWASSNDHVPASVASAKYTEMRLKLSTPKNTAGIAVDIYARMERTHEKTGGRLMLEDNSAAREFCEKVKRATDPLYPPAAEKPRRKWLGKF